MKTINIQTADDRYTVREMLRRVEDDRVLMVLPWDVDRGWLEPLDYEIQRRMAERKGFALAWVIEDPARRAVAREAGLPVFGSHASAERHLSQTGAFPPLKSPAQPERPTSPWWAPAPRRPKVTIPKHPPVWLLAIEGIVALAVLAVVAAAFLVAVPSATITLYPAGAAYTRIVPIATDATLHEVDLERGIVPSRRVGEEFEGHASVVASGRGVSFSGRASGTVLFTNLLGQDYEVPMGTIVRTSAGSYPMRYATTGSVTVPAFGQAEAPVRALTEGPRGNVNAYQINTIEGVVGFAVRVTNPSPITGAETTAVRVVSQEDRERVWNLAAEQALASAYDGLQALASEDPGLFLPRQTLVVQAAPKTGYSHLVGEETDYLSLALRLLITGQAVQTQDVQAVAYRALVRELPPSYTLTDARFEYGEAAEEDIGPGDFTFFVTAHAYATAKINPGEVEAAVTGKPIEEAIAELESSFPLSTPPEVTVTPSWFPWIPFVPIKIDVQIVSGDLTS